MSKNVLKRKDYERIKKMDHMEMNNFIAKIFQKGYEKGKKSSNGLSEEETMATLLKVKGIGEKKATDIIVAMREAQKSNLKGGE